MNVVPHPFRIALKGETDVWITFEGPSLVAEVRELIDPNATRARIVFKSYRALFTADEGDLTRYWGQQQFKENHVLFEVLDGGLLWQESQTPGLLVLTAAIPGMREWFVCTSNNCLTVLSEEMPTAQSVDTGPRGTGDA